VVAAPPPDRFEDAITSAAPPTCPLASAGMPVPDVSVVEAPDPGGVVAGPGVSKPPPAPLASGETYGARLAEVVGLLPTVPVEPVLLAPLVPVPDEAEEPDEPGIPIVPAEPNGLAFGSVAEAPPSAPVFVAAPPVRAPPSTPLARGAAGTAAVVATRPGGRTGRAALMTMSPNCSCCRSRPSASYGNPVGRSRPGGCPTRPGAASTFWRRIAAATSRAVTFRAASFCGSSHARML
jgi:hypothetical protein